MAERLFVACELPAESRRALAERVAALCRDLPRGRLVKAGAMHLTLAFLGDVETGRIPALDRELGAAFAARPVQRLRLEGVGGFPSRGRMRVVWIGVESDGDLDALRAGVVRALERVLPGVVDDRKFHPHVTLARCAPPWPRRVLARLEAIAGDLPGSPFDLDAGTLFASELRPGGPRYRALARYPLGAAS